MNATSLYRQQQLAIAAAIDSGDYEKASDLLRRDLRTFAAPERAAPERSGTTRQQKSDKKALTAPRKCGIIKAIRRHLRR
jgi:Arc/MetJ-type ribon-helix-helix transcriptional regulator